MNDFLKFYILNNLNCRSVFQVKWKERIYTLLLNEFRQLKYKNQQENYICHEEANKKANRVR